MVNKKYKLENILELIQQGFSQNEVARKLGCDYSVIWKTLQKECPGKTYNEWKSEQVEIHKKRILEYEKEKFDNLSTELKHKFDVFFTFCMEYLSDLNERIKHLEKKK